MEKKTFIHHRSIFANGDINITKKKFYKQKCD